MIERAVIPDFKMIDSRRNEDSLMSDITLILQQINSGDASASGRLLTLVYDELHKMAKGQLASENPGHTLQPTALVNEVYLRLFGAGDQHAWLNKRYFYGAAAQAMRRILVESARSKQRRPKISDINVQDLELTDQNEELPAIDEALNRLESIEPVIANLVKLRYFTGLTIREAAECLEISPRTANNYWDYAKAWLFRELKGSSAEGHHEAQREIVTPPSETI
jgi:RNA polymerase sigma factor (TIGR02999 family)